MPTKSKGKTPTGKSKKAPRSITKKSSPSQSPSEGARPRIGLEATIERVVPHEWTINAINPLLPSVLSTPAMIALMEHATVAAVRGALPPDTISVGTRIEVDHLKALPDGATIQAHARLIGYQGRFLVFDVEARSGEHVIGRGRVFRAIVIPELHGAKAKARIG